MLSFILATFLVSDPWFKPHTPEPYLGFGFSMTKQNYNVGDSSAGTVTGRESHFKNFATLGFPFYFNQFELLDSRAMRLMVVPELMMGVNFWGGSVAVGPEMLIPMGAYQIPDAIVWGLQVGPSIYKITDQEVVGNTQTTALLVSPYFGPQFDFGNACSLKLQINPRFYFGRVAGGSMRSEWSDNIGAAVLFNAQLQF